MNFQEKVLEASADLRDRAGALAQSAIEVAKARAGIAARRLATLKGSIVVLNGAGRELNKVARRHATRFVKQNSTIAAAVRDDVSALARTTYASLARRQAPRKARAAVSRKRTAKAS